MKTVPTLIASGSGVAVSALGFALGRQESFPDARLASTDRSSSIRRSGSAPLFDMTSTATCTVQAFETYATPRSFHFSSPTSAFSSNSSPSARQSLRSAGSRDTTPSHARPASSEKRRTLKRNLPSRDSGHMASDIGRAGEDTSDVSGWGSTVTQAAWKRLSTFSSNDSSLPSSPRPSSAVVSHSNNSLAFSNTGSTAPMFSSLTSPILQPNKLVKRNSSVRSTKSNSKLPIPASRRPATSHQRDATFQEQQTKRSMSLRSTQEPVRDNMNTKWKNYFTPKVAADRIGSGLRRHSTGIPNPIRRVCPDRKYRPVLLSGAEDVERAAPEVDAELDTDMSDSAVQRRASAPFKMSRRVFSSPVMHVRPLSPTSGTSTSIGPFGHDSVQESLPRVSTSTGSGNYDKPFFSSPVLSSRSFSPVPTGSTELPKWKRPQKSRLPQGKPRRKGDRSVSGPELSSMGNTQGTAAAETDRPAKRREAIGILPSRRSFTKSRKSEPKYSDASTTPLNEIQLNLQEAHARTATLQAFNPRSYSSEQKSRSHAENNIHSNEPHHLSSPVGEVDYSRPSRQSATLSDLSSFFGGSDGETSFRDEDSNDVRGDNYYDSVRTRATSAGSAIRGPAIENFFDDSHSSTDNSSSDYEHSFQKPLFLQKDTFDRPRHSVIEEEEGISTPVRSHYGGSVKASPETFRFVGSSTQQDITSSPPSMPSISRSRPSPGIDDFNDNESSWSFGDADDEPAARLPVKMPFPNLELTGDRLSPFTMKTQGSSSVTTTPSKGGIISGYDKDARSSIFDWSEQQPLEKSPANGSPPRPRTVHGKKDAESRGSRSAGRRPPATVHVRSQSVPVAPEVEGKRSQVVTNKFGTWGVGSKGVTEDWNEDFDFEEPALPTNAMAMIEEKKLENGKGMVVPKAIREQQNNVLANICLLRDWGLLIEEMKELRIRATQLRLVHEKMDMWNEVDAMIDLADQESNDHTLAPRNSPPSSPSFDFEAFDEPAMTTVFKPTSRNSRHSLLLEDIFESPSASPARKATDGPEQAPTPKRPRKDSEAVARSVIEALQQRRNVSDPTHGSVQEPAQKVPFDTATLKRIVPYVHELRDKIKRTIREAEGLYTSPVHREPTEDPSFSRMFREYPDSPSGGGKSRRSTVATDHVMSRNSGSQSPPDELTGMMKLMTVV